MKGITINMFMQICGGLLIMAGEERRVSVYYWDECLKLMFGIELHCDSLYKVTINVLLQLQVS